MACKEINQIGIKYNFVGLYFQYLFCTYEDSQG